MDFVELRVEKRGAVGKEASKKLRSQGKLPAVLHDSNNATPLIIDLRSLRRLISNAGSNAIIKLSGLGKEQTVMLKEIQRNPLKDEITHVDLLKISTSEAVETNIPIEAVGDAVGVKEGGVLEVSLREIHIKALPAKIPEKIEVDVSELGIGGSVKVGDLTAIEDVEILSAPDETIATVVVPTELKEEEVAPEAEEEAVAEEGKEESAEEEEKPKEE